ncbi:MAG: DUF4442 domain-containing protein [Myxococcota bacterium]|nr:DUF4442 domain-containing protein [Myxococcota bacterium]MEC9389081.1 DUF4442 domain-containing protein [Myxococcota bacterium]
MTTASSPSAATTAPKQNPARATRQSMSKTGTLAEMWHRTSRAPGGKWMFSFLLGRMARYTGSIGATIEHLETGRAVATMRDRPAVRNHLKSIHAIALVNLGELATGACVMYQIDGKGRGILKGIGIEYHKKSRGLITATCEYIVPDEAGTHDLVVTGTLTDADGDAVATVTATWRVDIYPPA